MFGDKEYIIADYSDKLSWTEAENECVAKGGHLPYLLDEEGKISLQNITSTRVATGKEVSNIN